MSVGKGIAHGLAALFGLGEKYDPIGDLRSELTTARDDLQRTMNLSFLNLFDSQDKLNNSLWSFIKSNTSNIEQSMQYYNTIAMNEISKTNTFTLFLGIMVLVILFFMIFK
jgi:hypothetical protein